MASSWDPSCREGRKAIDVLDEDGRRVRTLALFPEDWCEALVADDTLIVQLRLSQMQLRRPRQVAVEEAYRNLKGELTIRPVLYRDDARIEAHILIAFLAYCMQVTLIPL